MSKFQSVSLPSLSDSASMREVENESRKMGLDLLAKINTVADSAYPVGATYTQYPGTSAPSALFGGSWQDITATSLPVGVYDSGSNANGSWIRYTDGTMECWNSAIYVLAISTGFLGGFFGSSGPTISFPVNFISAPTVTVSENLTNSIGWMTDTTTSSTFKAYPLSIASQLSANRGLSWQAIGKWSSSPVYPVTLWKRVGGTLQSSTSTTINTGIYDSGTNANGSWIRFTDGTMMCWNHIPLTSRTLTRVTLVSGIGWYEFTLPTITFPIQFISQPSVTVGGYGNTGNIETIQPYNVTTTTMLYAYQYLGPDAGATTSVSYESDWVATGKWK